MSDFHLVSGPAEDGYLRPLSIFERVDDPTMDPAPIEHSMPPRDRLLPGVLTLTVLGGILATLVIWPELLPEHPFGLGRFQEGSRRVDFLLAPAATPDSSGRAPALGNPTAPTPAADGAASRAVGTGSTANTVPASAAANLKAGGSGPDRAGAGGAASNGDQDPDRGAVAGAASSGDGLGSAQSGHYHPQGFDHRLVPIFKPVPGYTAGAGESLDFLNETVTVIASVAEDGTVTRAWATAGPQKLFQLAVQAAMRWRFEPLAAHGLQAPQEMKIVFHCRLL